MLQSRKVIKFSANLMEKKLFARIFTDWHKHYKTCEISEAAGNKRYRISFRASEPNKQIDYLANAINYTLVIPSTTNKKSKNKSESESRNLKVKLVTITWPKDISRQIAHDQRDRSQYQQ